MAYNDSGELPVSQSTYSLGGYTFEFKVETVHEPGEPDVVSVFAICRSPDGTRETVPMDFPAGTTVESWSVEANETEATVYANIKGPEGPTIPAPYYKPVPSSPGRVVGYYRADSNRVLVGLGSNAVGTATWTDDLNDGSFTLLLAQTDSPNPFADFLVADEHHGYPRDIRSYTYNGLKAYYVTSFNANYSGIAPPVGYAVNSGSFPSVPVNVAGIIAWHMLYGKDAGVVKNELIARFAIDIREADGGPDGDWDEPGDTGDPSYTLNVFVTGASSGSNNGTPLEAGQTGGYGNGGTGGNGGGGGAGASTVIIYDFVTDKAGTVNQEATSQGPGSGGPGGKGGKGGDGCILIFY